MNDNSWKLLLRLRIVLSRGYLAIRGQRTDWRWSRGRGWQGDCARVRITVTIVWVTDSLVSIFTWITKAGKSPGKVLSGKCNCLVITLGHKIHWIWKKIFLEFISKKNWLTSSFSVAFVVNFYCVLITPNGLFHLWLLVRLFLMNTFRFLASSFERESLIVFHRLFYMAGFFCFRRNNLKRC